MYGKDWREDKTEEELKEHSEKLSKAQKGKRLGKDNPSAKPVICLTTKRIFHTLKEGADIYGIKNPTDIANCCKGYVIKKQKKIKIRYAGKIKNNIRLKWKFIRWNHNKKYRIKK